MRPLGLLVRIVWGVIFTAPSLWIAGSMLVGGRKARFSDAVLIVVLGVFVEALVRAFVKDLVAPFVQLVVWLYLVKLYFETSWAMAFFISMLTVVVFFVVSAGLAAIIGLMGLTFLAV